METPIRSSYKHSFKYETLKTCIPSSILTPHPQYFPSAHLPSLSTLPLPPPAPPSPIFKHSILCLLYPGPLLPPPPRLHPLLPPPSRLHPLPTSTLPPPPPPTRKELGNLYSLMIHITKKGKLNIPSLVILILVSRLYFYL